jgi:hypothetical protein
MGCCCCCCCCCVLQVRNGPIHQAGDLLLRLLLWWGLFLPLGAVCSVDSTWLGQAAFEGSGAAEETGSVSASATTGGLGALGLVLQMGSVYFFTAMVKVDTVWSDGTGADADSSTRREGRGREGEGMEGERPPPHPSAIWSLGLRCVMNGLVPLVLTAPTNDRSGGADFAQLRIREAADSRLASAVGAAQRRALAPCAHAIDVVGRNLRASTVDVPATSAARAAADSGASCRLMIE